MPGHMWWHVGHSPLNDTAASESSWPLRRGVHRPARATARSIRPLPRCILVWARTTKCAPPARPRSIQLTAEAGPALRSFAWCGTLVSAAADSRQSTDLFTRIAEVAASASCASLKAIKTRTKLACTSPTQIDPNWTATCSMFKGATGQPMFNWKCKTFLCNAPGSTTALAPLARKRGCRCQLQSLSVIIFHGKWICKATGPPGTSRAAAGALPECLALSLIGHNPCWPLLAALWFVAEHDGALAVAICKCEPQSEALLGAVRGVSLTSQRRSRELFPAAMY